MSKQPPDYAVGYGKPPLHSRFRKGTSGKLKPLPVYACASTGRFEANLLETVRDLVRE